MLSSLALPGGTSMATFPKTMRLEEEAPPQASFAWDPKYQTARELISDLRDLTAPSWSTSTVFTYFTSRVDCRRLFVVSRRLKQRQLPASTSLWPSGFKRRVIRRVRTFPGMAAVQKTLRPCDIGAIWTVVKPWDAGSWSL